MKAYRIIDEYRSNLELGYIFYYESKGEFSIEISPDVSMDEAPIFLGSFIKRNQLTIAPEWSARWVQARIIPPDRQNLGGILKENNLKEYDPHKLLELSEGRCAQDDSAIVPVKPADFPKWLRERLEKRIEFVFPLAPKDLLIFWKDGQIRRVEIDESLTPRMYPDGERMMERLMIATKKPGILDSIAVLAGGTGISWGSGIYITTTALYGKGKRFPVDRMTLDKMMCEYMMSTSEVCRELDCSRQYVSHLTASHELPVLKEEGRVRLYARSNVERLRD